MVRLRSEWVPRTDRFRPRLLAAAALDLLLPPACVTCPAPVDAPGLQCGTCFGELDAITEPCCACCGVPFELTCHAIEGGLCQGCIDTPPPFEHARAGLNYDKAARRLVLPFKHGGRTEFAAILAKQMARAGRILLRDAGILVPVPLHRRRLFVRRYNQAALLARTLGQMTGRRVVVDALIRQYATASLGRRSATERRDEVGTAIGVRRERVEALSGHRIVLIDDVMTSGATARACTESLLAAGAASVDVLVAVRAPDPRLKARPEPESKARWEPESKARREPEPKD